MNPSLEDLLEEVLAGNATPEQWEALRRALEADSRALQEAADLASFDGLLRLSQTPASPAAFAGKVVNAIRHESETFAAQSQNRVQAISLRRRILQWGAIAAAAAFAIYASWMLWRPVAALDAVRGVVTVIRQGKLIVARDSLTLHAGDIVRTGMDASVNVHWQREATSLSLKAGAELRLNDLTREKRLGLLSGALVAQVAKQAPEHPMVVETRQGRVEVIGTRFAVDTAADKTRVEVASGRVLLAGAGQEESYVVEACHVGEVNAGGDVEVVSLPIERSIELGMLAHWPLNEGQGELAADTSGNGRDAIVKGPAWSTQTGRPALDFPGSKSQTTDKPQYLRTPEFSLPPAFTITFWLRTESRHHELKSATRSLQMLFGNSDMRSDVSGFHLLLQRQQDEDGGGPNESLTFRVGTARRNIWAHSRPHIIQPDVWHCLAVKVDQPAQRVEMCVDGESVTKQPYIGGGFGRQTPLWFGSSPGEHAYPLDGLFSDIRIYDRLLDAQEISRLSRQSP